MALIRLNVDARWNRIDMHPDQSHCPIPQNDEKLEHFLRNKNLSFMMNKKRKNAVLFDGQSIPHV